MRYEVLGPLRIVDGDDCSFISARKIETVLAVLLIRADQVVAFDQLVTEIWDDRPPRRATAAIHVYISQLRKFLDRPGHPENPIITRSPGYLLCKGSDEIDFQLFLHLTDEGRALARAGCHEEASSCFKRALGLWRGPVAGGVASGAIIDAFATWLMESRLECWELLADTELEIGRHRELIGPLYTLIAENPWREKFYRQLMLALYRSERQADALQVYQMAWKTLNDELGLEPCRALRDLQCAILAADRQLDLCAVS